MASARLLDAIACPVMTAHIDTAKSAGLAMTLLDWQSCGRHPAAQTEAAARILVDVWAVPTCWPATSACFCPRSLAI